MKVIEVIMQIEAAILIVTSSEFLKIGTVLKNKSNSFFKVVRARYVVEGGFGHGEYKLIEVFGDMLELDSFESINLELVKTTNEDMMYESSIRMKRNLKKGKDRSHKEYKEMLKNSTIIL